VAAAWVLYWLGGLTHVDVGYIIPIFNISWVRNLLAFIGIVWMINLYNFMDGVDGLAAIEAISVSLFAGGLLLLQGSTGMAMLCLVIALSVGGFLMWNWPPAKIFMGDVGSGFLGLVFGTIAIVSENSYPMPLFVWLLLLGVFVIDATATLIWRVCQGEKWYKAHRTHVYQLAVQAGYTHKQVTLTVLGINMVLALLAYITIFLHLMLWGIALGAALVLLFIQIKLRNWFEKKIPVVKQTDT
jgi:Fuc2NAc and GlcNAc transferase